MKKVISIVAALAILTALTACGSGSQPEPSTTTASQTATEATTEDEGIAQVIDPFEGVNISSNGNYPDVISVNLDIDESLFKGHSTLYNKTILSADTSGMKIEVSFNTEAMQSFLSENNYEISEEKKIYDLPVEQMQSAAILNIDQVEKCKSDLLKKAEIDIARFLNEGITYKVKHSIALLPLENTVFVENTPADQVHTDLYRVPRRNIVFCFECTDDKYFVALGNVYLNEGSFTDLNDSRTVFTTQIFESYDAATEFIDSQAVGFEKVEFSIE